MSKKLFKDIAEKTLNPEKRLIEVRKDLSSQLAELSDANNRVRIAWNKYKNIEEDTKNLKKWLSTDKVALENEIKLMGKRIVENRGLIKENNDLKEQVTQLKAAKWELLGAVSENKQHIEYTEKKKQEQSSDLNYFEREIKNKKDILLQTKKELQKSMEEKDNIIRQLKEQTDILNRLNAEIIEKKEELKKVKAEYEQVVKDKENYFAEREGELNFQENCLEEKKLKLKEVKYELEKWHGKKLSHINL